jgi:hypothetical protein
MNEYSTFQIRMASSRAGFDCHPTGTSPIETRSAHRGGLNLLRSAGTRPANAEASGWRVVLVQDDMIARSRLAEVLDRRGNTLSDRGKSSNASIRESRNASEHGVCPRVALHRQIAIRRNQSSVATFGALGISRAELPGPIGPG